MKRTFLLFLVVIIYFVAYSQVEKSIINGKNIIHLYAYGEGEPILIINGGPGMNCEGFGSLAKTLSKSNKTIIYDQRGTGKSVMSSLDTSTITLDSMLYDIETIRKHLKIDKWVVMGHSFGGMLASYYASKFPSSIKGLILSSSGGVDMSLFSVVSITGRLTPEGRDSMNYWSAKIDRGDTTHYARLQRGKFLAPAYLVDQSFVPTIAERLTQLNPEVNVLVFQDMRKINFDCKEKLKTFSSPVLIIQGEQDIVVKSIAEIAHKIFTKSELVILKDCGHYGWLDQPGLYFEKIASFLKSCSNN